jgi:solute carrier family 25 phosphate transporter 23/24/25/41
MALHDGVVLDMLLLLLLLLPLQMKGKTYNGQMHAFRSIWTQEGLRGFYRGWTANTIKVVPQNAIRLVSYEALKSVLQVRKAKTDT